MLWPYHFFRSRTSNGGKPPNGAAFKFNHDTEEYINCRFGSFWIQCSDSQGRPTPDSGSEVNNIYNMESNINTQWSNTI